MLRREDGQMIPALVMLMLAILAVGVMFFQVGKAAVLSTEAQTAADAAALAAARNVRDQLMAQVARTGTSDLALIDQGAVEAAARDYAARNGAVLTKIDRQGVDVKVWVTTEEDLGDQARPIDEEDTRGEGRARARVGILSVYGGGGGGSLGPLPGGGDVTISDEEWDEFGKTISKPPTCGPGPASSNDIVKLGRFLQEHGALVGENAAFDTVDPVHVEGSYHYRCGYMGALDVNYGGNEAAIIDALIGPLQRLGYRTIWRTTGHFDHVHIDGGTGSIGAGYGGGGAVGPLEDTTLDVKLIDWEAAYLDWGGFGGLGGGGFFAGPPDPNVARVICAVARELGVSPKVLLSAFEAAIVESGVHSLPYGDRDSLGVFQQRPSQGWGTPEQIMNPRYAATQYLSRAISADRSYYTPGQLAQAVQRSAFPLRYDQVRGQAGALMAQYCG